MKKVLIAAASIAALSTMWTGVAGAERVTTPLGTVAANEEGYVVVADGKSGNPDPADGYIGVSGDGACRADDAGGPYNDDGSTNSQHVKNACEPPD